MEQRLERLQEWGCDIAGAMERVVEDESLYFSCLDLFLGDESFAGLAQALEEKNYNLAFEHAHALKGVAANLGLQPLYQPVCRVVEMLRAHETQGLEEACRDVMAAREQLAQILKPDEAVPAEG